MSKTMQRIGWGIMALLSLAIVVTAAVPYAFLGDVIIQDGDIFAGRFGGDLGALWLYVHVVGSGLALLLGPFQFIKKLRDRYPVVHRWTGRVYLLGILFGGVSGLIVAQESIAGMTGRFGFSLLALAWLYTGWQAYTNIRQGRTQVHKDWMTRNFALTFAAVTLRFYIGVGTVALSGTVGTLYANADALFLDIYRTVPWLCWVPNLLIAEAIVARRHTRREAARGRQPVVGAVAAD